MVNVISKRCAFNNCNTQAYFNIEGESPKYCSEHKEENMIDVRSKKCEFNGCNKKSYYNIEGEISKYCSEHKEENMVNVISKRCELNGCNKLHSYNIEGEKSKYCLDHKEKNMVNVIGKKCKSNKFDIICPIRSNKKYDNYCVFCFMHKFPNDKRTKNARIKTKEIAIKNFLYENGHEDFLHDKSIFLGDCSSRRRIDFYKYIGNKYILCIEVDENQHKYYNKQNEEQRYNDVYPLNYNMIFIRYNPDKYKDKNGNNRNPLYKTRTTKLLETINNTIKDIENEKHNEELLYVKYLYYDENKN